MSQKNEFRRVFKGILLVAFANILALLSILLLILSIHLNSGGYGYFVLGTIGVGGFFIWQLLYLIPLCIWLKRKQKKLIIKGVIIGAMITALINVSYVLFLILK